MMQAGTVTTTLKIPSDIVAGLASQDMILRGGVVQFAEGSGRGGQIVAWLREAAVAPNGTETVISAFSPGVAQVLGMVGGVASLLNLGATVAFGAATLAKLDRIDAKIDKLAWTVELGFKNVLLGIDRLEQTLQLQLLGTLRAASELAWSAQTLEPNSTKRDSRLENALSQAYSGMETLLLNSEKDLTALADRLGAARYGREVLRFINADSVKSIRVARAAASAGALTGRIYAEQEQLEEAARVTRAAADRLRGLLLRVGKRVLRGRGDDDGITYDELLNVTFAEAGLSAGRIDAWARRFDDQTNGLVSVVTSLQGQRGLTGLSEDAKWKKDVVANVVAFMQESDGAWEDVTRLDGYSAEYEWAAKSGMGIAKYRDLLRIDPPELDGRMVVLRAA